MSKSIWYKMSLELEVLPELVASVLFAISFPSFGSPPNEGKDESCPHPHNINTEHRVNKKVFVFMLL